MHCIAMARFLPSVCISDVATAHIFFLDFWTILLESRIYILSLSLSATNWGSYLKHWPAFEVSLSLIWNNSNVFSRYTIFTVVRTIQHFGAKCTSYVPTSHSDFPINHCSHCVEVALGGRQVHLGFASVYLNFDCASLRGVIGGQWAPRAR